MTEYFCSKHPETRLTNVFSSGAGHCSKCGLYVQAAGVPMPVLPPRPLAVTKRKRAAKKAAAKKARQRKASAQV